MDEYELRVKAFWAGRVRVILKRCRRNVLLAVAFLGVAFALMVTSVVVEQTHLIFVGTMFLGVAAIFALLASDDHMVANGMKDRTWILPRGRRVQFRSQLGDSPESPTDGSTVPMTNGLGDGIQNSASTTCAEVDPKAR